MLHVSHTMISAGTPLFISGSPAMAPDIIYTSLNSRVGSRGNVCITLPCTTSDSSFLSLFFLMAIEMQFISGSRAAISDNSETLLNIRLSHNDVWSYSGCFLQGSKLSCLLHYAKGDGKKRRNPLTLMVPDDGFQHIIEVQVDNIHFSLIY